MPARVAGLLLITITAVRLVVRASGSAAMRPRRTAVARAEARAVPCNQGRIALRTPHAMLKVVIADDHRLILEGIKHALIEDGGFEIVGEASTGEKVLPLVSQTNPDLVVLDLRMPGMDGLVCLDQIKKRHPKTK